MWRRRKLGKRLQKKSKKLPKFTYIIYGGGEKGKNTLYLVFREGKNARYSVFLDAIYYICDYIYAEMAKTVEKCEKLCEKSVDIG